MHSYENWERISNRKDDWTGLILLSPAFYGLGLTKKESYGDGMYNDNKKEITNCQYCGKLMIIIKRPLKTIFHTNQTNGLELKGYELIAGNKIQALILRSRENCNHPSAQARTLVAHVRAQHLPVCTTPMCSSIYLTLYHIIYGKFGK